MVCLVVGYWRARLGSQFPAPSVGASLSDYFSEDAWRMFLGHRLCFHIGVCIWALLSEPLTSPHFSAIDVMAAGCIGLHRHQGGRQRGRHPTPRVSFRELAGPSCSWLGPGVVMWVLADVVSDVHLATMTSPGTCRHGPFLVKDRPKI